MRTFCEHYHSQTLILFYLPWHCLYFLPLPHAGQISILSILIILCVFPLFSKVCGQVTFYILSTIFAIFYIKYSSNVHKMCTNFQHILYFLCHLYYIAFLFYIQFFIISSIGFHIFLFVTSSSHSVLDVYNWLPTALTNPQFTFGRLSE